MTVHLTAAPSRQPKYRFALLAAAWVLLAGTSIAQESSTSATANPATANQASATSGTAGKQLASTFRTTDSVDVEYLIYLPENYDEKENWPLMLFLHGRGESFGPLNIVAKWGPPRFAARGDQLPFILVSPQCPGDDSWSSPTQQSRLIELLDAMTNQYNVDEKQILLSGLSMGGFGSWRLAADHPDRFAAVVPICGGGDAEDAEKLKDIPIWVFHGDQDSAVPIKRSVEMVEAIKQAGGNRIRFTTLEHVGHNSWSPAYAIPELYAWMSEQRRE